MADTYYAHSTIKNAESAEPDADAPKVETIKPGEEVSQASLGVSDEEWEQLVDAGSVRPYDYPDDLKEGQTPAQYYRETAQAAMEAAERGEPMKEPIVVNQKGEGDVLVEPDSGDAPAASTTAKASTKGTSSGTTSS